MKRIKNKTLIMLLFFCSFQYGCLFSMETDNPNPHDPTYIAPDLSALENPSDYRKLSNLLEALFTFTDENFKKEERIIYGFVKDRAQSANAKKHFRALSLILRKNNSDNANELCKYMNVVYTSDKMLPTEDILTQFDLDFSTLKFKQECIATKNNKVESKIASYQAPILVRTLLTLPSIKCELESRFVQRVILTACNKISNRLFDTHFLDVNGISNIKNYNAELKTESEKIASCNRDLNDCINYECNQTRIKVNQHLNRKN
jgi:hypothetical protein